MKINPILKWGGLLVLGYIGTVLTNKAFDGWEKDMQPNAIGQHVRVRFGYYQDCTGYTKSEAWSQELTDRAGRIRPAQFYGYKVDLTCDGNDIGDRTFSSDFLLRIK